MRRWLAEAAGLSRQLVVLSHVIGEFVDTLQTVHGASRHTVAQIRGGRHRRGGLRHRHADMTFDRAFCRQLARLGIAYEAP